MVKHNLPLTSFSYQSGKWWKLAHIINTSLFPLSCDFWWFVLYPLLSWILSPWFKWMRLYLYHYEFLLIDRLIPGTILSASTLLEGTGFPRKEPIFVFHSLLLIWLCDNVIKLYSTLFSWWAGILWSSELQAWEKVINRRHRIRQI